MAIKAVFFDLYGTLAGWSPSRFEIQSEACADFGIALTHKGVLRGYALADRYMAEQNALSPLRQRDSEGHNRFFAEYERLVLKGAEVEVSGERAWEIWQRIRQIPYELAPFDDVVPALEVLRERGLTLGLLSNMDRTGRELCESVGLTSHLDLAVTSHEVGAEKPNPAMFQTALTRAGVQSHEAMHVGDQISSDVEGALSVGINPVLMDRDGNYTSYTECPRIEGMTELPELVDGV